MAKMMEIVRSTKGSELCQIETAQGAGAIRRPGFLYIPMRILQNLKTRGLRYTFNTTVTACIRAARKRGAAVQRPPGPKPAGDALVLNLQPGETVEVKSLEEILSTLDTAGKLNGLVFTPEMRKHCNKQYRVFKRLELMFDEYHKSQRRVKNTVLLEGVVCEGAGLGCDRCCFLYWREAWLRRVTKFETNVLAS
jgi:hypothetical protein